MAWDGVVLALFCLREEENQAKMSQTCRSGRPRFVGSTSSLEETGNVGCPLCV